MNGLSYDDVLLIPDYSEIESRSQVDISVDLGKGVKLRVPIISANMKHVTDVKVAQLMAELGGLGILHRFGTIDEQVKDFQSVKGLVGASVGIKEKDRVKALVEAGCKIICIDVAHGHSKGCLEMTSWIAGEYPSVLLISGNIATAAGARALAEAGADVVKCGIGGGSICSTRIETGNGVPMMTSLQWVFEEASDGINYTSDRNFKIIADGGIKTGGDLVKALSRSDAVMVGNLLARSMEAPGRVIEVDGKMYKEYHGSSTLKTNRVEGVRGAVPVEGTLEQILLRLTEGLQSGCSYQGAGNLEELKRKAQFVKITSMGLMESKPHSIVF